MVETVRHKRITQDSRIKILRSECYRSSGPLPNKNAGPGQYQNPDHLRHQAYERRIRFWSRRLNQRDGAVCLIPYVEDENGNKKPVLNKKETAIAQDRQELIKQKFCRMDLEGH